MGDKNLTTEKANPPSGEVMNVETELEEAGVSVWRSRFWKKLKRNKLGVGGGIAFLVIVLLCIFVPILSPYKHNVIELTNSLSPPSGRHFLGTDKLGRDVATRLFMGGRVSLSVGVVGVVISISIGIILGSISGYVGGKTDAVLLKISEVVLCFPVFILILTLVAVMGPNIANIMTVLGLVWWTGTYRVIRNQFISIREIEFVEAARALGSSHFSMIFKEILPSAITPVLVQITLSINFLGDALRDALDPLTTAD